MATLKVKSQAALEFLVTYAWVFLGIMIAIGVLYYYGIFSFSKFLPQECIFPSQFECTAHSFVGSPTNQVRLRLVNNLGETIDIKGYSITNDAVTPLSCTNPSLINGWLAGVERDFTFTGCANGGFITKEKIKFNIEIDYYPASAGLSYAKIIFGEIFTTVQQAP